MKAKFYLISALLASASMAFAQSTVPTYKEVALPSGVSGGYFRGSVVFADINADGNMDLLLKGRDLSNGWNTEALAVTTDAAGALSGKLSLPFGETPYEATLTAFDFNNDGLVDYLYSNNGYELWRNDGDGKFTKMDNFALESNLSISDDNGNTEARYMGLTVAADFNNDGWQDLVVTDADGNPKLYLNNGGDGSFKLSADSGLAEQRGGTLSVGDFNKDGYLDLLVNGWTDSAGNDCIIINKNKGDGTFESVTSNAFVGAEKGQAMFVDIDGDGYLDVFVTGESSVEGWNKIAYIFRNNGDETFTKVNTQLTGVGRSGCDWIDVNNDGRIDIIYAGESNSGNNAVLAVNNGNLSFQANEGLLRCARGGVAVSAYDYNGDGCPDVAIMGYNDSGNHFTIFNGSMAGSKGTAPSAPVDPILTPGDGKVTLSWGAATDDTTPAAALRYNVYVRLKNGKIITLVPADRATGALRLGDVNAATTTCTYVLNISEDQIDEWAVQTIDGGKNTSAFVKGVPAGIGSVAVGEAFNVTCADGAITVSEDATVTVTDLSGSTIVNTKAKAGVAVYTGLGKGVYIVKAVTADGTSVAKKFIVK